VGIPIGRTQYRVVGGFLDDPFFERSRRGSGVVQVFLTYEMKI